MSHTIIVPRRALKIAVSVFDSEFITGLDLIHGSDKQVTSFGYRIPGKQTIVDLCGGSLTGFDIVSTDLGIHAIRAVTTKSGDILYNWAGNEQCGWPSPLVERLDAKFDLVTLSGEFRVSSASE